MADVISTFANSRVTAVNTHELQEKWGWTTSDPLYWPLKIMGVFSTRNTNALISVRMLQTCLNNAEVRYLFLTSKLSSSAYRTAISSRVLLGKTPPRLTHSSGRCQTRCEPSTACYPVRFNRTWCDSSCGKIAFPEKLLHHGTFTPRLCHGSRLRRSDRNPCHEPRRNCLSALLSPLCRPVDVAAPPSVHRVVLRGQDQQRIPSEALVAEHQRLAHVPPTTTRGERYNVGVEWCQPLTWRGLGRSTRPESTTRKRAVPCCASECCEVLKLCICIVLCFVSRR